MIDGLILISVNGFGVFLGKLLFLIVWSTTCDSHRYLDIEVIELSGG